jgi:tRNA-splicing ligase RtcB
MKILNATKPIKAWIDFVELEPEAKEQLVKLASLPFIYKHVAVMPDAHAGRGSTVGTVIATQGKIIPAAVGVDIGCGMMAVKLPFKIDRITNLPRLRSAIERSVPVGFKYHDEPVKFHTNLQLLYRSDIDKKAWLQLGTLGGGNHFIEVCQDQHNDAWVMVHSGSRGIGNQLASKHIERAKGLMKENFISLPDSDLAYLAQGTKEFDDYIKDLLWAQEYARYNREIIMDLVLKVISYHVFHEHKYLLNASSLVINCHHNYSRKEKHFGKEVWVTRKGAVSAQKDEYGIIPGSMGNKSFIVKGKGNIESFCSCSHGAGRRMSRTEAKKRFSASDLKKQTEGIECRKDKNIVDEIPAAYKNIDDVMKSQADLVEVVYILKQVVCVKG